MWSAFTNVLTIVNYKPKQVVIDNWVFKLHYRLTFWVLLAVSVCLATDSFGDKIKCSHSRMEDASKTNEKLDHVINQYCYYMGVHTVPRHYAKDSIINNREVKYAGVGPVIGDEAIDRVTWYPWVYYLLFVQAFTFYIPRLIWRLQEGRTIASFVQGFDRNKMRNEEERLKMLHQVKEGMWNHIKYYQTWSHWLFICEFLNLFNLIAQWLITDWFLGGNFSNLGSALYEDQNDFSKLDIIFPKMAKCTYSKFGPTGGLQNFDIYCILTYNIVYEKVYLILWYWYIVLATLTIMALIHRLVSRLSYNTSLEYNESLYQTGRPTEVNAEALEVIMSSLSYSEWLFLQYLTDNLEPSLGEELMSSIALGISNGDDNGVQVIADGNYQPLKNSEP